MVLSKAGQLQKAANSPGQKKITDLPKAVSNVRSWLETKGLQVDEEGMKALPKDLANKLGNSMRTNPTKPHHQSIADVKQFNVLFCSWLVGLCFGGLPSKDEFG